MATSGSKTGSAGFGGAYVYASWSRTGVDVNANTSTVGVNLYLVLPSGMSTNATEVGSITLDGVSSSFNNGTVSRGPGTHLLHSYSRVLSHDANGYKTFSYSGSFTSGWSSLGTLSTGGGSGVLDRLALAPSGLTQSVSNITTNSATVTLDISSLGRGTSAAHRLEYKLSTAGSYTQSASQDITDLAPNTFNLTGLTPNKTYNYRQVVWNNNGDTATSTASNFTTKSGVKLITTLGVEDRVVKSISPTGVVTTCVATKIL